MMIRLACALALVCGLAGCAAIEIDNPAQLPPLRVTHEAAQTAREQAQTTQTTPALPGAPPEPSLLPPPPALPGGIPVKDVFGSLPTSGTLRLTVEGAIVVSLTGNKSLSVEEINPAIRQTFEAEERAVFDPTVASNLQYSSSRTVRTVSQTVTTPGIAPFPGATPAPPIVRTERVRQSNTTRQTTGDISLSEFLPTGTTIDLSLSPSKISGTGINPKDNPYSTVAELSVNQHLLRGAGLNVNLASLRQARLDTLSSEYELRGFTENLVAQVEQSYWDYYYAQHQVGILEEGLAVAEQQLNETRQRIDVGTLASSERFAAEAEVAQRRETLINGRSTRETARLALLRLLSPPGQPFRDRDVELQSEPMPPQAEFDAVENHIALAQRMRPDLNQARLAIQRDELEIVKTRNGLLPVLDLFIILGKTGYASSFGESLEDLNGDSRDHTVGAQFSYPLGNRAARARHRRAMLSREQADEALDNLAQLAELDVRNAYIEINRVREQVSATAVTRALQQETLRTEQEKFRVGRSTSLLVAQAERDLLLAQISELQAFVSYLKAVAELYRLDGSLLERRGILCAGREPVVLP